MTCRTLTSHPFILWSYIYSSISSDSCRRATTCFTFCEHGLSFGLDWAVGTTDLIDGVSTCERIVRYGSGSCVRWRHRCGRHCLTLKYWSRHLSVCCWRRLNSSRWLTWKSAICRWQSCLFSAKDIQLDARISHIGLLHAWTVRIQVKSSQVAFK